MGAIINHKGSRYAGSQLRGEPDEVEITPEVAASLLRFTSARDKTKAERYGALMRAGQWQRIRNTHPVMLKMIGGRVTILNGKHRLEACSLSGVPVVLPVLTSGDCL